MPEHGAARTRCRENDHQKAQHAHTLFAIVGRSPPLKRSSVSEGSSLCLVTWPFGPCIGTRSRAGRRVMKGRSQVFRESRIQQESIISRSVFIADSLNSRIPEFPFSCLPTAFFHNPLHLRDLKLRRYCNSIIVADLARTLQGVLESAYAGGGEDRHCPLSWFRSENQRYLRK